MRKYRKNNYSVTRFGTTWFSGLESYDEALHIIKMLLASSGFDFDAVMAEIDGPTPLRRAVNQRKFWFKPNKYQIQLRVTKGELIEIDHKFTPIQNKLLGAVHTFNGDGLKYNTIEPSSKWNKNDYQPPEVRFALSAERSKGTTTLPKLKGSSTKGGFDAAKVMALNDHTEFKRGVWIDTVIHNLRNNGLSDGEIYQQLRGKHNVSNRELKRIMRGL